MKMELQIERRLNYDNQYNIDIALTEDLTKEDYITIIGAIKLIEGIIDPYINRATTRLKIDKAIKGGKE